MGSCGKETYNKHVNLHNPHFSRNKMGISLILSQQQLFGWTVENKEDCLERNMQELLLKQRELKHSLSPKKQDKI